MPNTDSYRLTIGGRILDLKSLTQAENIAYQTKNAILYFTQQAEIQREKVRLAELKKPIPLGTKVSYYSDCKKRKVIGVTTCAPSDLSSIDKVWAYWESDLHIGFMPRAEVTIEEQR